MRVAVKFSATKIIIPPEEGSKRT